MKYQQPGFIVPTILINITFIITVAVIIMSLTVSSSRLAYRESYRQNAQFVADAGLDIGIHELNLDNDWTGTLGEVTLFDDGSMRTTYETTVIDGAVDELKTISVVGRSYSPSTSTTPKIERRYELDVRAVTSGTGPAAVVSGVGGLILNNNSKISGGDVIVNGTVTVNNNAQIGLTTNSVNLRVAHQNCPNPVNASYPQVCASGENGQPIIANGPIYANVQATNQTNGSNMFNPGLITGSSYPPVPVPGYDRPDHKAAITMERNPNQSPVPCSGGTANWPANLKINGNVSLANNCNITINGDVWITGRLQFGNNSRIIVANTLGTERPVIMVDGIQGVTFGNNSRVMPNSIGTGAELITMWWNTNTGTNGGFTCGGITDPLDCTNVTGLALSTSQSTTTIDFNNNASASGTVLRSLWSRTFIANNAELGAVSGQTIQLGNNAVINFTASIPGSDNLIVTWVKRGYLRVFN